MGPVLAVLPALLTVAQVAVSVIEQIEKKRIENKEKDYAHDQKSVVESMSNLMKNLSKDNLQKLDLKNVPDMVNECIGDFKNIIQLLPNAANEVFKNETNKEAFLELLTVHLEDVSDKIKAGNTIDSQLFTNANAQDLLDKVEGVDVTKFNTFKLDETTINNTNTNTNTIEKK